jgi:hypothetical protein
LGDVLPSRVPNLLDIHGRTLRLSEERLQHLYYRHYERTPVTTKFLCVVVKNPDEDGFVLTAYFTDSIKQGELRWPTT